MKKEKRLYDARWNKTAKEFLNAYPLCCLCALDGIVKAATIVDHIKPHKGDRNLFWDEKNWQPLCKLCHDRRKQRIERRGKEITYGLDGFPIEDRELTIEKIFERNENAKKRNYDEG